MAGVAFFLLGLAAWTAALAVPPALALWSWNKGPRYFGRWTAHVLFAPALLAVEWFLVRAIFFAAHDDGEGPPGLGLALIPQFLLLLGTLVFYYVGVAVEGAKAVLARIYDD